MITVTTDVRYINKVAINWASRKDAIPQIVKALDKTRNEDTLWHKEIDLIANGIRDCEMMDRWFDKLDTIYGS